MIIDKSFWQLKIFILVFFCVLSVYVAAQELSDKDRDRVSEKSAASCKGVEGFGPGGCVELNKTVFYRSYDRCKAVVADLKDLWLYYDDFRIYALGYSGGGPVDHSSCTIHALDKQGNSAKHLRVSTSQRRGSARFRYEPEAGDRYSECRKLFATDCV